MTTLEVSRLEGAHRLIPHLQGISFRVPSGTIAALYGRPHAGKGLLLRVVSGLEQHVDGDIVLDGRSVATQPPHRRPLGTVMRDSALFPGTVGDNVAFGLKHRKWPKGDRERRVSEVLELVGMTGAEGVSAGVLDDSERMRVALARALAPRPSVLLLESPTWAVDEGERPEYRARLRELLRSLGLTAVIATDDLRDAVGIADDLHVMSDGHLLQSGSLSRILAGPSSIEVAELVGYVTLVRGLVDGAWVLEPSVGAVRYPEGFPLSGAARAMAHPSAMLGVPEGSGLGCGVSGVVERVRAIGPTYLLDLRVDDRTIEVRWEWDSAPPAIGHPIAIAVTPGTLRFFNEPSAPRPAHLDEPGTAPVQPPLGDGDEDGDGEEGEETAPEGEPPAAEVEEPPDAAAPLPDKPPTAPAPTPPAPAPAPPRRREPDATARPSPPSPPRPEMPQVPRPPADAGSRHRGMPLD